MGRGPAVLAVDGGNSKADLALHADDGSLLAAIRRPGLSHQQIGAERASAALRSAVDDLRRLAGLGSEGPVALFGSFCLAGADLPADDRTLGAMLEDAALTPRWRLRNDVFAVLRAGTVDGVGVAVVCGAGMNAVGVAPDGREVRYPALGALSGDWAAGGGWLGMRALGAAIRAQDGRGAPTRLATLVPAHFDLPRPLDVTEAIYTGGLAEQELVGLAPLVLACATDGDAVARELVVAVADELVAIITATMERLGLGAGEVPVVLGGGLFRSGDGVLRRRVAEGVARYSPSASVRPLSAPPVLGAALLGFDELGADADVERRATEAVTTTELDWADRD